MIVALAADLLATEADALTHTANRHQRARTRAAFQLLQQSASLAPTMHQSVADATSDVPIPADRGDERALAAISLDLSKNVLARTSDASRELVDVTMMPVTQLHDEQMFIRCIQIFESVYVQVASSLERAITALQNDDAGKAEGVLRDAATRVEATPLLFRVLTTMPRDAFAVIRDNTRGRSAIQSRSYRQVELLSARREASSGSQEPARHDSSAFTLQEVYMGRAKRWMTAAQASALATVMRRLDLAWRTSKRTHWGVTLKVIGSVPGTGGTSGADYLKHSADRLLFPSLDTDEESAGASR
ncbi:hypothetical protein ACFU5N_26335 [Streptomyces albidoflavus]